MQRGTAWLLTAATCALLAPASATAQQPIRGFPADALSAQVRREQVARAVPSADTMREQMRLMSARPHEAGTDRSRHVAEQILSRFRSYGLQAEIEEFRALMPRPVSRSLELVAPERFTAQLQETPLTEDRTSGHPDELPTFNAYSADGDVTGDLVFVNYGVPRDYQVLDSLGISVKGRIVIARYGGSWRGIKPKVAAEHGAIGCIIYSDPQDDGYRVDDVYPKGPMRPPQGAQRGSVMDMPKYPGDPLSPGWANVPGSKEPPLSAARTLVPIPVLPIGYGDALPLLRALTGPVAPESWRGALPITYHVGPGPARVHLALKFDWAVRPLYDVIARVPGALSPDQMVIFGNHHDAWVFGAEDPIAGQVALNESARAVGALLRTGWRPARSIVFAAWDGEEWGLLGSTEWVEKHAAELARGAVAYLGSDTNDRGWMGAAGSHSLEEFVRQVARDIQDPKRGKSVLAALQEHQATRRSRGAPGVPAMAAAGAPAVLAAPAPRAAAERAPTGDTAPPLAPPADTAFHIGALGSGSDYTAFIDHVGIPAVNISYGGEGHSGIYHSIYDSFDFYTRFLDPDFAYEVTEAQTMATAVLRLADAPVLPFEFSRPARAYRGYADEIERQAKQIPATSSLDLASVRAALDHVDRAAARYERSLAPLDRTPSHRLRRDWRRLAAVNAALYHADQALADPAGLPGRDWFRNLMYAPGYYTGYGVKTMAGIREAVEDAPDGPLAQAQAARVASALERYATAIESAAAGLETLLR